MLSFVLDVRMMICDLKYFDLRKAGPLYIYIEREFQSLHIFKDDSLNP